MKTKAILLLLLPIIYFGCSKDDPIFPDKDIKGSVFITVKDPDGVPVKGAAINMNNLSGITDEDGTIFFPQAILSGDDYVKVNKTGYFKGSRRFTTTESPTQFIQVTLLPMEEIASFNSNQFASMPIDSRSRLKFPEHSVMRADGSSYTGGVHVFANPIYGDDEQLSEKMPGSLTGVDQTGANVVLGSFGMLAVELQGDNGEELEIAAGKTVEVQLAVADDQLDKAPATIPLWYFDEENGYWVQEGEATLNGNKYIAQLPHFSFWNWDVPLTLVQWETTFTYTDGKPVQNARVCLTINNLNDQRCALTDANGVIAGPIPANEAIELTIKNECGNNVFTRQVGPFNDDLNTDHFMIDVFGDPDLATISGTALQCDGSPLASGFVKINTGQNHFIFPIQNAQGHYEGRFIHCAGDVITLQIYNLDQALMSQPHVISFDRELNTGGIKACDQIDEFIRYKINGFSGEYIYYLPDLETAFNYTKISSVDSIGFKGKFGFSFDGQTTGQFKGYTIFGNQINIQNGQTAYVVNMDVVVTEYGSHGQFIRGTFSGKISAGGNGAGGPGDSDYSGSFAVRRE